MRPAHIVHRIRSYLGFWGLVMWKAHKARFIPSVGGGSPGRRLPTPAIVRDLASKWPTLLTRTSMGDRAGGVIRAPD